MDKLKRANDLTRKDGKYKKVRDSQTDGRQRIQPLHIDVREYTRTEIRRTKKPLYLVLHPLRKLKE